MSWLVWLVLGFSAVPLTSAIFYAFKGMLSVGLDLRLLSPDLWASIGSHFVQDPFLGGTAWGALAAIAVGSLMQHVQMSKWAGAVGGVGVAAVKALGGKPAAGPLADRVARLGSRAGLPNGGPRAYVVPVSEANAFAAGSGAKDSVVAVTDGLLNAGLTDPELDAVLAHEIGHIRNGDTSAGMQVAVMIAGFSYLLSFSMRLLEGAVEGSRRPSRSDDDDEDGGGLVVLALAAVLAGSVLFGLGTLLQRWVSRRHEFDADEAAVAITGSGALSGALAKIEARGAVGDQRTLVEKQPQFAHLYIASHRKNGIIGSIGRLFQSHPSMDERRDAIERTLDRARVGA